MKKIIAKSAYWICANNDLLATIIEKGYIYLMSDGSKITDKSKEFDIVKNSEWASEQEIKEFAQKHYHYIFKGDTVIINRGRKYKGEEKVVKGTCRFYVDGSYNKVYTDYLLFTDGTKVNINHCDVKGIQMDKEFYNEKEYYYREYRQICDENIFQFGGRL